MNTIASPRAQPLPRHFVRVCSIAALATVLFAIALALQLGGPTSTTYISDAGTVFAPFLAALSCLRAGFRHRDRPAFWWLLAAACTAWMLGEMVWTAYDFAGLDGPPSPSWADVGYLIFIPLARISHQYN